MNRGQKKFLYGLFYLAVFGALVLAVLPAPKEPAPGPGAGAAPALPLRVEADSAKVFKSESTGRLVLIAGVRNPNLDFGAESFSYEFAILRRDGGIWSAVSGEEIDHPVQPNGSRSVISFYDAPGLDMDLIADEPDFTIKDAVFRPAAEFIAPNLVLVSDPKMESGPTGLKVVGRVKNQSASRIGDVKTIAVLGDKYGDPVFAAQTLIGGLAAFEEADFEVGFPADRFIAEKADAGKISVYFSPKQ
jgi:hypothetical protein